VYADERLPPVLPSEERWWQDPWPAILAALLTLIVGGVVGYVIGHNRETAAARSGHEAPVTRTVTHTTTVPKVITQTNTVTQTPLPSNQANEERRTEAETNLRTAEQENRELKRQLEEAGPGG
jgi:hypothetical protein